MELDGNFMQVIEGALFRKHAVEVSLSRSSVVLRILTTSWPGDVWSET